VSRSWVMTAGFAGTDCGNGTTCETICVAAMGDNAPLVG
jgi:hypothetical protein